MKYPNLKPGAIFILIVVCIPAYQLNKFLLKRIQPNSSFKRLILYLAAVLAMTLLIIGGLLKYAWPVG